METFEKTIIIIGTIFMVTILITSFYMLAFVHPNRWEGNPAQMFCEENGGDYYVDDDDCAICRLKDGREVNAWDYFYGRLNETG